MIRPEAVLGLPDYQVTAIEEIGGVVRITVRFIGKVVCPHCGGCRLRMKDLRIRRQTSESGPSPSDR